MSLKEDWKFKFSAGAVLAGAQQKLAHHQRRLAHWNTMLSLAKEDLRTRGIDWRDAVEARQPYTQASTRHVAQPTFDETKLAALREAQERVSSHQRAVDRYEQWIAVLTTAEPDRQLKLDFDDVVFFGLDQPGHDASQDAITE